jgi:hypothetical protein
MSKFKGPFDNNGSFDDVRYYYDPVLRRNIISQKGGPTREQFLTHPNYEVPRRNSNELGGRSKFASLLKKSLNDVNHLMYPHCFGKIMTAGRLIQHQDSHGDVGFRKVAVNNASEILCGIDFNVRAPFRNVFKGNYETTLSSDNTTVSLSIPEFIPTRNAQWITNYNAFRCYLVIGQISDMAWNANEKEYQPIVSNLEVLSQFAVSDWMGKNTRPIDIELTAVFEEPALTMPNTAVIAALGLEFATSMRNGKPFTSPDCGTLAIVACYSHINNLEDGLSNW